MSQWKFQIISNRPDFIAKGRLMDEVCDTVANEVNSALRYPFKFHKVNKIVICLGRGRISEPDYVEQLGVALKQWPDFDLDGYKEMDSNAKINALQSVVLTTFDWIESNFHDAQFVAIGRQNLTWQEPRPPTSALVRRKKRNP